MRPSIRLFVLPVSVRSRPAFDCEIGSCSCHVRTVMSALQPQTLPWSLGDMRMKVCCQLSRWLTPVIPPFAGKNLIPCKVTLRRNSVCTFTCRGCTLCRWPGPCQCSLGPSAKRHSSLSSSLMISQIRFNRSRHLPGSHRQEEITNIVVRRLKSLLYPLRSQYVPPSFRRLIHRFLVNQHVLLEQSVSFCLMVLWLLHTLR